MKILTVLCSTFVAAVCIAADPTWNPADAVKEAEQDIRSGHIKFYWAELGTVIDTILNIELMGFGSWIRRTKATTRAGNGGSSMAG